MTSQPHEADAGAKVVNNWERAKEKEKKNEGGG
jgi:hypothetical protein